MILQFWSKAQMQIAFSMQNCGVNIRGDLEPD
jgi:hypothetical protein